ncbi:Aldehyde/histidinol dehydrogenase [Aspergillus pseudoustus]|uniref:Aldehyde/histidinol dehydrogenase n=1 Tax=Aspergillus pseudoustus TaxID=1810923 RepID=A0ABR4IPE9_9EURO
MALAFQATLPEEMNKQGEVEYAASFVRWFAEEASRTYGDTIPSQQQNTVVMTIKQPVGVCGIITLWNFPAAMVTRKVAPALAAGCSVVIKPPSETPHTCLALVKLAVESSVPGKCIQVCPTRDRLATLELATNPKIAKIRFTGSTGAIPSCATSQIPSLSPIFKQALRDSGCNVIKCLARCVEIGSPADETDFPDMRTFLPQIEGVLSKSILSKYGHLESAAKCMKARDFLAPPSVVPNVLANLKDYEVCETRSQNAKYFLVTGEVPLSQLNLPRNTRKLFYSPNGHEEIVLVSPSYWFTT